MKSPGGIPRQGKISAAAPSAAPPDDQLILADEQKMVGVEKPHHNDVLCGRGVTTNRHPGNESFRSLVGLNKVRHNISKIISPSLFNFSSFPL